MVLLFIFTNSLLNNGIIIEDTSEIRTLILNTIKEQLHKDNRNDSHRICAIQCLRNIIKSLYDLFFKSFIYLFIFIFKETNDPTYLNAFWKECASSWEYQPYLTIPFESLELGDELGQGTFGRVLRGTWRKPDAPNPVPVAIKFMQETFQFDMLDLRNEVKKNKTKTRYIFTYIL